ncbi:MAG: transglutaminase TgpA family protein [Candidatus Sumerlaeaceae bacterium]|jgi:transglutaminase-like putative cysteine protease
MKLWDRFQFAVALLAFWSTLTLATTGELDPWLMTSALIAPAISYVLRRSLRRLPWWLWDVAVLGIFVWLVPLARHNLLNATVYFFMALQSIRLFSFRRLSDAYSIYVVSFFQIFGAALLTTSPTFGVAFVGYLFLIVRCFLLHSNVAAVLRAQKQKRVAEQTGSTRMNVPELELIQSANVSGDTPALLKPTLLLGTLMFSLSIVFFMLVPRLSTRRVLQSLGPPPPLQMSSAFDENIEFGKFGTIQLDTSVALYVKPLDDGPHPTAVRMRGVALDTFDGTRWQRTSWATYREPFGMFCTRPYPLRRSLIIQPANTSKFLFGETFPLSLLSFDFQQALLVDPSAGVAWLPYAPSKELHYTVVSRVEDLDSRDDPLPYSRPSARIQRTVGNLSRVRRDPATSDPLTAAFRAVWREFGLPGNVIAERLSERGGGHRGQFSRGDGAFNRRTPEVIFPPYREACLRIPESMNKQALERLANEITRGASTPFDQAMAIEAYLRRNYQYSLEIRPTGAKNPIEHFLFESKGGHCEYFATAMAMLLRAKEIPCRVVNGFYSTEWNNLAGMFTVRQRDAHSWVEVFFDGYGWMTFDPTPPAALQRPVSMNPLFLAFTRYYDALKIRWYRAVIDFSIQDQRLVAYGVFATALAIGNAMRSFQFESAPNSLAESFATAGHFLIVVIGVILIVVAVIMFFGHRAKATGGRNRRHRRQSSRDVPRFYADLLIALQRRGYFRDSFETPLEFASRVAQNEFLKPFEKITLLYYAQRYGGVELSAEAEQTIAAFRKVLRRGKGNS